MSQHPPKTYIVGHNEHVLRTHKTRNIANSAAYLIPSLTEDMQVLDVGCGPGTITIDFARRAPKGKVIGIDNAAAVIEQARGIAAKLGVENVEFQQGNVLQLDFPDATFDIVHAHQVIQYVKDPAGAIREMRRVTKPGGVVAIREWDCSSSTWYPPSADLDDWKARVLRSTRSVGGEPDAGRRLVSWALQAGFDRASITSTAGTWSYSSPEEREWFSGVMIERLQASSFALNSNPEQLLEVKARHTKAWQEWGSQEDGWYGVLQGEIVCKV